MIARRVRSVPESLTLALTARARALKAKGVDVIAFTAGELDFPPPAVLTRAIVDAIEKGDARYTDSSGRPDLREAIAAKLKAENGLAYDAKDVLVSCGAKHSIYNLVQVLCDPGDEVLIPAPFWLSYADMARLAEATPVLAQTLSEHEYVLAPAKLAAAISDRTRVLILNSPCNPTGAVYPREALVALAEVLRKHPKVAIISDEIYEKLVYDGEKHVGILEVAPDLRERTIVVNGMSKSFAITGLRLGYAAGPREVIAAAGRLQSHSTSNPTSIVQAGALAAMKNGGVDAFIAPILTELTRRRNTMVELLRSMPGISIVPPRGAFYCFPALDGLIGREVAGKRIAGAQDLAEVLLEKANVVIVPGEPFGSARHFRLSFAMAYDEIERGLLRMAAYLREHTT